MSRFKFIHTLIAASALLSACQSNQYEYPYKDPKLPVEERIDDLIERMTLEEKIEQLHGSESGFDTKENKRLGIPAFHMTDGPVGVRRDKASAFPVSIAMAASWDTVLIHDVGIALARETKAKGLNCLLGPCINIHRFPTGGRNFESFGEDPFLTSRLAVSYITGVQGEGVLASVKHFALNNQEWERMRVNVKIDERAMHEIYLSGFEAAVKEAHVWTVMAAYNKVNGYWCSENSVLLNDVLKKQWNYQGLVVSDWGATHSTVDAANNGLDLEMPTGTFFGDSLFAAVKQGKVSKEIIDEKVRRILRVKFEAGLFDRKDKAYDTIALNSDEHKQLALKLAEESIILLKNENNFLPFDEKKVRTIAVIGSNAAVAQTGGGGSSKVEPFYSVSPLQGLQNKLGGNCRIEYAIGVRMEDYFEIIDSACFVSNGDNTATQGLHAEYFNNTELKGKPEFTRIDKRVDFNFGDVSPDKRINKDHFSARWTGQLVIPVSGTYKLMLKSDDGVRLYLDNKLVINDWTSHSPAINSYSVNLKAKSVHTIRIEYFEGLGGAMIQFGWTKPDMNEKTDLEEALRIAKSSDVALIFAGYSDQDEYEGADRKGGFSLPPAQVELIKKVASVNPRTVVVLNTGTPVPVKEWIEKIPSLLLTSYPGQEGGNAIANVLFGKTNPSGKLPFSFIADESQSPAYKGYMDKGLDAPYSEGIFVGYRYLDQNNLKPSFSFGFGLSYTSFRFENFSLKALPDNNYLISVDVTNTGKRAGSEVVQLYLGDESCSVPRPKKELKAFGRVTLEPGEKQTVVLRLNSKSFAFYDVQSKEWITEKGFYNLMLGNSSRDIKFNQRIEIK
jgi:beta-glucosidase